MKYSPVIHIGKKEISITAPTYFIADIAANHDGDFQRAKDLIYAAKEAGADAVKFQHFKAEKIVSDRGFRELGAQLSHQVKWNKPVFEVYRQYECNRDWNLDLVETAKTAEVDFMTTPYDTDAVEQLDPYLLAYKIGSGDITWTDFIATVAQRNKPVLLACGASSMADVERAVETALAVNPALILLQCNTNYTGSLGNFRHINLRVLQTFAVRYPGMLLGLSDHTPGHTTVLGAIALGARVIEKHLTDDNSRVGPDHPFSMNPKTWREMVDRARDLEAALGTGIKIVEANEVDTVVVQQRCLRLAADLAVGHRIAASDLEALRPAPKGGLRPYEQSFILGRCLKKALLRGHAITREDVEE